MTKRRIEPLVWMTFSGGGVTAAMFLPVLVFLFALAFPLGWIDPPSQAHLLDLLQNPLTFLVLLGIFTVMLVHAAHRFRYTLYDGLQLKWKWQIALLCYGGAIVGAGAAFLILAGVFGSDWPI
jgi:succinate dehydrogenase subunit D